MPAITLPDESALVPPYTQVRLEASATTDYTLDVGAAGLKWARTVRIHAVAADVAFVGPRQDETHFLTIKSGTALEVPLARHDGGFGPGGTILLSAVGTTVITLEFLG